MAGTTGGTWPRKRPHEHYFLQQEVTMVLSQLGDITAMTGVWVRMSPRLQNKLAINQSGDHAREFGRCIGVVAEHAVGPLGETWPEVEVYWADTGLHYSYLPEDLEVVEL